MSKQYNNEEISRILCQDLIFSRTINDRLDETYALIRANARQIREGSAENSHRRVRKMGRRKIGRRLGLAAAVMVLLAAASLAVVAAGGFFVKNSSQTGDSMTYEFKIDYTLVPKKFEAKPSYLPEGYKEWQKGKYEKDEYAQISIRTVNMDLMDSNSGEFDCVGVESVTTDILGGMDADIVQLKENKMSYHPFDKRVYLFNPDKGYAIALYGTDLVEMGELKKVADSIIVTETEEDISYTSEELKKIRQQRMEEENKKSMAANEAGVPADAVTPMGEEAGMVNAQGTEISDGVKYKVTEVIHADSISELPDLEEKYFIDYEDNSWWIREDGTLKPQGRAKADSWPLTGDEEIEQVQQKYLLVRVRAKNNSDSLKMAQGGLFAYLLRQEEDGHYSFMDNTVHKQVEVDNIQMESRPFYFDGAENIEGEARSDFYYYYLEPGEEKEYTLIWAVDEDVIDNVCLMVDYNGMYEPGCYDNKRFMSIK